MSRCGKKVDGGADGVRNAGFKKRRTRKEVAKTVMFDALFELKRTKRDLAY